MQIYRIINYWKC